MDEIREGNPEQNAAPEQIVFLAPELLQKAQQRQERLGALRAAAESGDHVALLELGIYDLGELGGTPRDADEAFFCLSRLPGDDPVGLYYLSYCYDRGVGTEATYKVLREAVHYVVDGQGGHVVADGFVGEFEA